MTACDTKNAYRSKPLAWAAVQKRLRDNPTIYLRIYVCSACGMYHLTSKLDKYRKDEDVA